MIKVLFTVCFTYIDNLEQKLCIIENVGVKYHGPLFIEKDDHTCYIIKYSVSVPVLYVK